MPVAGHHDAPSLAVIVSHTHWDREWYRTFHQFRTDLVYVVREVLDRLETEDAFRHFMLDGQAIILEDYLEIHPEDKTRIQRLVERGALAIGPWYILPDEFLVSGEATVRNLLVGHDVGTALGGVQKVGYLPDSFGHIAQMPQILRQAGIDSFVYTRGNGDEISRLGSEYFWEAPDGSSVLAINQSGGYCSAGGLGLEKGWHATTQRTVDPALAVSQVSDLFRKMQPLSQGGVYLISNGCDHYPPQRDLDAILEALQNAFPDTLFEHSSLHAYVQHVQSADFVQNKYTGELISGRDHFILPGVWSARMYLKQLNDRAQTLLAGVLEPLSAYSHFMFGRPYPSGTIDYAWKLLLENHPHDSICGCSTDGVHRDMLPRFTGVIETAEEEVRHQLVDLAPTFARQASEDSESVLCVANPLPRRRTEVVERLLVFEGSEVDVHRLGVVDTRGSAVPHEVVDVWYVDRFWDIDYRTELFGHRQSEVLARYVEQFPDRFSSTAATFEHEECFLTVRFLAEDLPPLGHRIYRITELADSDSPRARFEPVTVSGDTIENRFCQIRLHADGTFDLRDKHGEHTYMGLNRLTDTEDVGDEYDYAPAESSTTVTSQHLEGTVRTVARTGLTASLEAAFQFPIPARIASDRRKRAAELVGCSMRVRVTLHCHSPVVEIELEFQNLAMDHRLRTEFPTDIVTDTVISDGHFYVNHRPIRRDEGAAWLQPPSGTYPQQGFSLVEDGHRGLAVLSRGLPEIEATNDTDGHATLAVTLLRSVGWLSRDDFDTRRRRNAGPMLPTPDAQCLGTHRFHYGVVSYAGSYRDADICGWSQRFRTPVVAVQGVLDQHTPGDVGLLEQETNKTCITAIKKHESRDTLIVRLYNLTGDEVSETLTLGSPVKNAWRVSLLEERGETLEAGGREIRLTLGPYQILTVELEIGARS